MIMQVGFIGIVSFALYKTIEFKILCSKYEREDYIKNQSELFDMLVEYLDFACMKERINTELFQNSLKIKGNIKEAITYSKLTGIPTEKILEDPLISLISIYKKHWDSYIKLIDCKKTKYGDKLICEILDVPVKLDILDLIDNQFEINQLFNAPTRIEEINKNIFIIHVIKDKEFDNIKGNKILKTYERA